jgi:surfeit locus 1 family protein
MPKEGLVVWVQRGWVPRNFVNRTELPMVVTPSNLVQVHGRIAPPPSKLYEPGRAEEGTIRQNLDLDALTLMAGQTISPVILQQQGAASEGLQRDWPTFNSGVDKHYGYAAQWFGLCGLIAALYLWFQIVQPLYFRSKKASLHV